QIRDNMLEPSSWSGAVRQFIIQANPKTVAKLEDLLNNRFDNLADWAIARSFLFETGFQAMAAIAQEGEATEKASTLDRMRSEASAVQSQLQAVSNTLEVADHAKRKEIADIITRIIKAVKSNSVTQSAPVSRAAVSASSSLTDIFFDVEFYEA